MNEWGRLWQFARYIPAKQVARRGVLRLRRALDRWIKPSLGGGLVRLSETAPLSNFQTSAASCDRSLDGWDFTFLNRREHCSALIDWQLGGRGAENQLWRMNLHYFEWLSKLDSADFVDAIDQWIRFFPPYVRDADQDGWNAYALSIRVVIWLQQLALRRADIVDTWVDTIVDHSAQQLRYLEGHLETDIGGNHLYKNIRALVWGSMAIESTDSPRWRRLGLRLLRPALTQILPDGMHFERSTSYHAQVLGDLLDIRHALGEDPFEGFLDAAIARAAQVAADLTHPDGRVALFGDSGLGMAPDTRQLRESARTITGQSFEPRMSYDLSTGGYAGLRSGKDLFVVDAGSLGPDSLPGHAHGDIGSFEWSVNGNRMIVDQGVYTYVAGDRRHRSRSASSHNTLAAPFSDQGDFFSSFRLGRRCRVNRRSVRLETDRLQVDVGHDGFVGRHAGVTHRRQIDARVDKIVIMDELIGDLPEASIGLLLAPGVQVQELGGRLHLTSQFAECSIETDGKPTIETAVWWPDMGVELATQRIRIVVAGRHTRTVLSVISRKVR